MKPKNNDRTWLLLRVVVSRTTLKLCVLFAIIEASCSSEVHAANANSVVINQSTTPMVPNDQLKVAKVFVASPKLSPEKTANDTNKTQSEKSWSVGNELWDGIIKDCYEKPTYSCFQKNVFTYLDKALDISDVNITNRLAFYKNKVDYSKYTREANEPHNTDNEIPDEPRSESHIEEVTSALYGKSVKFAMTHDVELKLPEIFFDGATIRVSPRSIEGNGAIVKMEIIPRTEIESRGAEGRIFKKKIFKFFKNKLLLSFLALLLIIKLIKVKLFWILPIIVGVSTAKKLILKFLLFLFPALAHIFKLCSYYHSNYHQTKFHTHHHHINHHHTIVPPWIGDHDHHHAPEIIYTTPPKGPPAEYFHGGPPIHSHHSDWESSGPGLGSEYIGDIHRNSHVDGSGFRPKLDDMNEIHAWGLGTTFSPATSHSYNVNPFLQEPPGSISQKMRPNPVYISPQKSTPMAAQIAAQYDPNINQHPRDVQRTQAQVKEALRIQAEQRLVAQQQKILQQQPFVQDGQPLTPKGYDPFYSPILSKVDKILHQLGFTDDFCKERLVCSMYKNPNRYSPHSNFISAELSRDTSELEKPEAVNAAIVRFYRFVQAAREGQDQRDCLQLYPQCTINTE